MTGVFITLPLLGDTPAPPPSAFPVAPARNLPESLGSARKWHPGEIYLVSHEQQQCRTTSG